MAGATLPQALSNAVSATLVEAGDAGPLQAVKHAGGGSINHAARIETARGRYFLKWHDAPPPRFFACEADGLTRLAASGVVSVPTVVGHSQVDGAQTAYLIVEWIPAGDRSNASAEALGHQLAELHRVRQDRYGLDYDNYIGRLPQPNTELDSWVEFYRTQRLGAQRDQARANGRLPTRRAERLERLMARLSEWIDESKCQPSLLHGDLWGGNWMAGADSRPVLIDPAVYVGDREADLAMTALFGGFPRAFYDAYEEAFSTEPGAAERQPLYQLYYLLCHLNLFGESYGGSVDAILRRYVG